MLKILVAYHDKCPNLNNGTFVPVFAGAALSKERPESGFSDDIGENISEKNKNYNEMTVVYWAYKNYGLLNSPDYIGLNHYARYFIFEKRKYAYYQKKQFDREILNDIQFENFTEKVFDNYDFIAPLPSIRKSVYKNYCSAHHREDIDLAIDIIAEKFPQIFPIAEKYANGKAVYFYNMFIFKKDDFFKYCDFVFPILSEYESRTEHAGERFFISEFLTGVFFSFLKEKGKKAFLLPVLHIYKKPNLKQAISDCKNNFKYKRSGFLHKIKPLLVWLIPNRILLLRKRRTVK